MNLNASMANILRKNELQVILGVIFIFGVMGFLGLFSPKYLLLLPLGFLFVAFVLYKPFWGLCVFAFAIPLEEAFIVAESLTALKIVGAFVFVGWLSYFLISRQRKIFMPRPVIISFLFAGWGLVSYFWAAYPDAVLWREITVILLVGFFFLVPQIVTDERKLHYLILSNVLGAMVAGGFGLYYFSLNPNQRIVAFPEFGQNAGHYGILLSIGIFYFLTLLISKTKRIIKIFSFIMFLLLLVAAFASGTRSFMVSFAVSLLFLLWYLVRMKRAKTLMKLAVVFCIIGIIIISIMPPLFFQRAQSILTLEEGRQIRLDIWKVYLVMIAEHPLVGTGLLNGPSVFDSYRDKAVSLYGITFKNPAIWAAGWDAHNIYIRSWAELGICGFILLLSLITILFKYLYSCFKITEFYSLKWQLGLIITLEFIALLVTGIAEPCLFKKYLWFGFSLTLAYGRIVRNSEFTKITPECPPVLLAG